MTQVPSTIAARPDAGFTLVELMVTVIVIGILTAIGLMNYIAMQNRAKEASTKSNMVTFQLAAEDYNVVNDEYSNRADSVATLLPGRGASFRNPFDQHVGQDLAWEDRTSITQDASEIPGIVSYSGNSSRYNVKGHGKSAALTLILQTGQ